MEPNRRKKAGQPGPVENARPALPYAQIPMILLTLPTGERAAAIEVWAALHHHLRLGSSPRRITDEELGSVPWLIERSRRYRCNGLDTLARLGLITRDAAGSSRRVAIVARLRSAHILPEIPRDSVPVTRLCKKICKPAPEAPLELSPEFLDILRRSAPRIYASVHEDAR